MDPCQPDAGTRGMIITPIMMRRPIKDLNRSKYNISTRVETKGYNPVLIRSFPWEERI